MSVNAISHNTGCFTSVGSDYFSAYHQQAMFIAQNVSFYQHVAAFGFCQMVGGFYFNLRAQFE